MMLSRTSTWFPWLGGIFSIRYIRTRPVRFIKRPCANLSTVKTTKFPAVKWGSVRMAKFTKRSPRTCSTTSCFLSKISKARSKTVAPASQPTKIAVVAMGSVSSVNPGNAGSAAIFMLRNIGKTCHPGNPTAAAKIPRPTSSRWASSCKDGVEDTEALESFRHCLRVRARRSRCFFTAQAMGKHIQEIPVIPNISVNEGW